MVLAETFYLQKLLKTTQTQEDSLQLSYIKNTILQVLSSTPKALMHFDYHSANLMLVKAQSIAILDFQDCKIGPIGMT